VARQVVSLEDALGLTELTTEQITTLAAEKTKDASFEQQEVHTLARTNLDFLAALAMPEVIEHEFPVTYLAIWTWLLGFVAKSRDFSKLALGLPRGFAKTSLMKIFILYCILFTDRKFILIIAASASLAENIIADIVDMLDEDNIVKVFGNWRVGLEKDTQELKKFGFRGRNIILKGIGVGTGVRGIVLKNSRPDVMVFDDIQTREASESQIVSTDLEKWMIGTCMKAKAQTGCMYIFLGNMYPTKWSILRRLKHNPTWVKFIAGAILADGTSLWEALVPIKQLEEEFASDLAAGYPEIFYSEVLNDEHASTNNAIDLNRIGEYKYTDSISAGSFIVIDPSNDKSNSDLVSIGCFHLYEGVPVLTSLIEDKLSPGDTIKQAILMATKNGTGLIVIEANAYQYSLCYWFEQTAMQLGLTGIQAVPIYSGSLAKNTRILTMFKQLIAGEIVIHPDTKSQVYSQITQFNPLKRDNTDGILDLLTYAPRVLTELEHLIVINSPFGNEDYDTSKVWSMEDNCLF